MRFLRGPMTQLAWVVEDVEAAERAQPEVRWTRLPDIHFDAQHTLLRGEPADCVQRGSMAGGEIAFAYLEPGLPGLPVVEVVRIGDGMRAFYESLRTG